MKRRMMAALIFAALFAAPIALAQQEAPKPKDGLMPKIVVAEMRHDMGQVAAGKRVSHVFEIRNAGTATLVIEKVQPS